MPELYMLILAGPVILFSLVLHEFAHGLVSVKLGDPTPKIQGRLSLNPLVHLDPLGTLMLILSFINGVGFGWAKPVQINPNYYKNAIKGSLLVAVAGPTANLMLALFFGLPIRLFSKGFLNLPINLEFFLLIIKLCYIGVMLNLSLAFFNLLPIPPLDGSKVVRYFLRGRALDVYNRVENYGFYILIIFLLVFRDGFSYYFSTMIQFFVYLITGT
jgi:Zn-dependent protease